jgi:hypothetical protein
MKPTENKEKFKKDRQNAQIGGFFVAFCLNILYINAHKHNLGL